MVSITPGIGDLFILNFAASAGHGQQLKAVTSSMQSEREWGIGINGIYCVVFVPLNTTVNFH
jgi:hypothetical protein